MSKVGSYSAPAFGDLDNDGDPDLIVGAGDGFGHYYRNNGIFTTKKYLALNPTWIYRSGNWLNSYIKPGDSSSRYGSPEFVDIDGDGDYDLAIGSSYYGHVCYWKNEGTPTNPAWVYQTIWLSVGDYSVPSFADIDGDGDFDMVVGAYDGLIRLFSNEGSYITASSIVLRNSTQQPVVGASVTFTDESGVVCSVLTDSAGSASCNLTFVGGYSILDIANTEPGYVLLTAVSPAAKGTTTITLENSARNIKINLERMTFNLFTPYNEVDKTMRVMLYDEGKNVFMGTADSSGYLEAYMPKKYLINKEEPYTQNRITYDASFFSSSYGSTLTLNDVYAPNEINISSADDTNRLYKFLATGMMATDAQYKSYVIYPAIKAQKEFNIVDSIPTDFSFVGVVGVEYLGKSCSLTPVGNSFSINQNTAGCKFLASPVTAEGDWVKVSYTVQSPSMDLFIANNWSSKIYNFPAANITLYA